MHITLQWSDQYCHKSSISHLCCAKHHTFSSGGHHPTCWDVDLLINSRWNRAQRLKHDFTCSRMNHAQGRGGLLQMYFERNDCFAFCAVCSCKCAALWLTRWITNLTCCGDSFLCCWLRVNMVDPSLSLPLVLVWPSLREEERRFQTKVFKRQTFSVAVFKTESTAEN